MTQDKIIRMAWEAGFTGCLLPEEADNLIGGVFIDDENWIKPLEHFAALVAAHEREACAKVCEENGKEPDDHKSYEGYDEGYQDGSNNCAVAIRSRSNEH